MDAPRFPAFRLIVTDALEEMKQIVTNKIEENNALRFFIILFFICFPSANLDVRKLIT